jgi:GNAT superfamily N-acetyltransferase
VTEDGRSDQEAFMPQDLMERDIAGAEPSAWSIRRLYALEDAQIDGLADLLIDCVEGGAPVSFLYPLPRQRAAAFWQHVAQGVAAGERALLVAEDARGVCGTVHLVLNQSENQPHRAYLSKMLVHRRARRQGLGEALLRAAEATARELGVIPGYALLPRGGLCDTTVYYRNLGG